MYIFFPYIIILAISFVMLIVLSIYGYKFRDNIGVKEFIFCMTVCAWWVLSQAFELMATDFGVKYFWATVEYLGAGLSTFGYLMLSLRFSGSRWLTKRNIIVMLVIYAFFYFCVFTDMQFGLIRRNLSMDTSSIPYVIIKDYGPVFPVYILFTYSMNIVSFVALVSAITRKDKLYKRQSTVLLIAMLIVSVFNLTYVTKIFGNTRFDYTPAVFGIATAFLYLGIFKHKLLNIIPISRHVLVDKMDSGLVVIDRSYLVVDCNNVFCHIFSLSKNVIGSDIKQINLFNKILLDDNVLQGKVYDYVGNTQYKLNIKCYPLDTAKHNAGTMYVIQDVTEQYNNNKMMVEQQKLIGIMNEREKLGRDLHDSFGQVFGYVNIQAQTIKEYLRQNDVKKAEQKLNELIEISKDSHAEIRDYILHMKGLNSKNRNFRVALKQYIMNQNEKYGMEISLEYDKDFPTDFPSEQATPQIIRIIQESINNVRKHAGECNVIVAFQNHKNSVCVEIRDTGCGFDTQSPKHDSGYGLSIMNERASDIGGTLHVKSSIFNGTSVTLTLAKEKV